jgi:hypothetical protein
MHENESGSPKATNSDWDQPGELARLLEPADPFLPHLATNVLLGDFVPCRVVSRNSHKNALRMMGKTSMKHSTPVVQYAKTKDNWSWFDIKLILLHHPDERSSCKVESVAPISN